MSNTAGTHSTPPAALRPAAVGASVGRADRSRGSRRARDRGLDGARAVTVLVAEDEESFVDALVIGLGREGFDVSVARDGPEALALFDSIDPDLVLLDIMLPKMSGVDVCRAIRARSHVPIIMVTAKGTEIDTVVGPRGRGRRLRHQALPPARARGPDARRPAPVASRRAGSHARPSTSRPNGERSSRSVACGSTPTATASSCAARRSTCGARSSSCSSCSSRTPAGSSPGTR